MLLRKRSNDVAVQQHRPTSWPASRHASGCDKAAGPADLHLSILAIITQQKWATWLLENCVERNFLPKRRVVQYTKQKITPKGVDVRNTNPLWRLEQMKLMEIWCRKIWQQQVKTGPERHHLVALLLVNPPAAFSWQRARHFPWDPCSNDKIIITHCNCKPVQL